MNKVDKSKIENVLINIGAVFVNYDVSGETKSLVYLEHHERWPEIKEQLEKITNRDCVKVPGLLCFIAHLRKLKMPANIPKGYADSCHLRDSSPFDRVSKRFNDLLKWINE